MKDIKEVKDIHNSEEEYWLETDIKFNKNYEESVIKIDSTPRLVVAIIMMVFAWGYLVPGSFIVGFGFILGALFTVPTTKKLKINPFYKFIALLFWIIVQFTLLCLNGLMII